MDEKEYSLKDAMVKMSRTTRYQFKRLTITHELRMDGAQALDVNVNTQSCNKSMDQEEMKVLYSVLRELMEGKDD